MGDIETLRGVIAQQIVPASLAANLPPVRNVIILGNCYRCK
jgi:hypothetical protein